ncbi:FtsB family cell division protein [Oceanibaculum nanhaiense]|uniref:FtsB family cell division protein n=1 Tax=Oceanibaculum nanhaiense TaxID=1909734 RepID=UPI00396EF2D9
MDAIREIRRRARHAVGPVCGALLLGYFVYHAVQGERGLLAWRQVDQQIAGAEATLAEVQVVHERLARRVSLLEPASIDPDMLDERARIMLNLVHADEVVVFAASANGFSVAPDLPPAPDFRAAKSMVAQVPVIAKAD